MLEEELPRLEQDRLHEALEDVLLASRGLLRRQALDARGDEIEDRIRQV